MDANRLLCCPFCGGEASEGTIKYAEESEIAKTNDGQSLFHYCNCIDCGVSNMGIIGFRTPSEARNHWNMRVFNGL